MDKTISTLVSIVKTAQTKKDAAKEISRVYNKLSPSAAMVLIKDVEDYLEKVITKTELSLFLVQAGLPTSTPVTKT